jgi:hypothetical protein
LKMTYIRTEKQQCSKDVVTMVGVVNAEALIEINGYWPSFHDAVVSRLVLDRGGVVGVDNPRSYTFSCARFSPCLPITQGRTQ